MLDDVVAMLTVRQSRHFCVRKEQRPLSISLLFDLSGTDSSPIGCIGLTPSACLLQ